jgi:tetratricopeptide (TPR) repeat protein
MVCANAAAQVAFPTVASVPPEFAGPPIKFTPPDSSLTELYTIVSHLTDGESAKSTLPALNDFISKNPSNSDARYLRTYSTLCLIKNRDFDQAQIDLQVASQQSTSRVYNKSDFYSLLGKISFAREQYPSTVSELFEAISRDYDSTSSVFQVQGVKPVTTSGFCEWNLGDLDALVKKFPGDYRVWLFRGLYYQIFTTFGDESYYTNAEHDFLKAAAVNPRSPLPPYYLGTLYYKKSFWTKKAWSSDAERDAQKIRSIQPFTAAIRLDANFVPALEARASSYLDLKRNELAIKDFDKVLELDSKHKSAHSDRGIAEMDLGRYGAALMDFDDSIRNKEEGDSYLSDLHEFKGDIHVKLRLDSDAIGDYSKAIGEKIRGQIILFSVREFRALYPEYDGVSDQALLGKLRDQFYPAMKVDVFAEAIRKNSERKWGVSLLNELYEKRAGAYLRVGDYRRGVLDFQRIYRGIPDQANFIDRWQAIGKTTGGDNYFVDVKASDVSETRQPRLWVKSVGKEGSETTAFDFDCKGGRLRTGSSVAYDSKGNVKSSSDDAGSWSSVIPDTIGEKLSNGACSKSF